MTLLSTRTPCPSDFEGNASMTEHLIYFTSLRADLHAMKAWQQGGMAMCRT
jgi:hypothetical protein